MTESPSNAQSHVIAAQAGIECGTHGAGKFCSNCGAALAVPKPQSPADERTHVASHSVESPDARSDAQVSESFAPAPPLEGAHSARTTVKSTGTTGWRALTRPSGLIALGFLICFVGLFVAAALQGKSGGGGNGGSRSANASSANVPPPPRTDGGNASVDNFIGDQAWENYTTGDRDDWCFDENAKLVGLTLTSATGMQTTIVGITDTSAMELAGACQGTVHFPDGSTAPAKFGEGFPGGLMIG